MKPQNNKQTQKRLAKIESLYRNNEITDKAYDILDAVYRLDAGLLSVVDIEDIYLPTPEK